MCARAWGSDAHALSHVYMRMRISAFVRVRAHEFACAVHALRAPACVCGASACLYACGACARVPVLARRRVRLWVFTSCAFVRACVCTLF